MTTGPSEAVRDSDGKGERFPLVFGLDTFGDVTNDDGLLTRHDYDVEINAGNPAAHYVSDYDEVAGIRLPTKHRIFPRTPDGQSLPEPLFVSIDVSEIAFA